MRKILDELDGLDEADVHNKITYLLKSLDERHLGCDLGIRGYIYISVYISGVGGWEGRLRQN